MIARIARIAKYRSALPLAAIACFSGFAGLGYEVVWTRFFANSLGHEMVAILGVLAGLFGGLALGSLLLGRRIARSAQPTLWYTGLEIGIGVWALILVPVFPVIGVWLPVLMPLDASEFQLWAAAFIVPSVLLLPATLAMGATLPALEAILASRLATGKAVGLAYAANTFGAVCGTLATTFWIMPAVGLSHTLMFLAAMNIACAIAMAAFGSATLGRVEPQNSKVSQRGAAHLPSLFLTGLLGIGYEVVAVRTLSQILENTVYTFAALLSVYLLGTAVGAALHGRLSGIRKHLEMTAWLSAFACGSCVLGIIALGHVDAVEAALRGLPQSLAGAVAGELVIAGVVFLLPTIAMGMLFTELAQTARDRDGHLARALAANTAGAAIAPLLFGPMLFPLLGAKLALILIAVGYVLVAPSWGLSELAPRAVAAATAILLLFASLSLRFVQIPPGGSILWHRDGTMASVSVVEDRAHDRYLEINNHFRLGGTASIRSDYREADIPLLLHPNPKRALFLGLGTGTTISATADYPGLSVEGVELVPEVPETFSLFEKSAPKLGRSGNIRIYTADARRYVRTTSERYDVIVADVYHPWIDGAGTLYTLEHFAAIRNLLTEGGVFCQWLPLHQLDLPTLRVIMRTFLAEFPYASAYLAQFSTGTPLIALIGRTDDGKFRADWFGQRVADEHLRARLASVDLTDEIALFGLFLAGRDELAAYAGAGPLNTDDHQLVTFNAPRMAYTNAESAGERLLALLNALHGTPSAVLEDAGSAGQRLAAYWRARNRFLELGVQTTQSTTIRDVIGEVAPQLIEVVGISADFDAAYRPVLAMASQLARTDRSRARRLLMDLDRANPKRPEARRELAALPAD